KQHGNGSIKYPYYSIQQAVDDCCLSSGGTVSVAAGIYNESVYINKEIALIGAGATQTTITASGLGNTNTVTFEGTGTAKTVISGFKITGATRGLFDGGIGIFCYLSSSPTIINNTISGNSWNGIDCFLSSPIITNNIIAGNNESGIYCNISSPTIINNTIAGNNENGIYCSFSSSPNIYNNIITQNSTANASYYGITNNGTVFTDYNCIWGNGQSGSNNYSGCSAGLHDISANPQFIGGGSYHLQANSPCINRGTNALIDLPETDMDGNPRILQTIVDMGAYESCYPATITGNISYSGTNTGKLYCLITDNPGYRENIIAYKTIPVSNSGVFKYEIVVQNPGTYYLTCFLDADGNSNFSSEDVMGIYGSLSCVYLSDTGLEFVGSFAPINIRAGAIVSN
ncbi:MAG: right-handed parallel beta-helix repeat-containing protein, partial [Candidatus Desantisbacteria bacterium]